MKLNLAKLILHFKRYYMRVCISTFNIQFCDNIMKHNYIIKVKLSNPFLSIFTSP